MAQPNQRVVVVGASLAGVHAARTLRSQGFGGEIVVVDRQRHQPYDRPPLSKQLLRGEQGPADIRLQGIDDLDVVWRLGVNATEVDLEKRQLSLDDDRTLEFDGLVIASGARARRLPGVGDHPGITVLRELDEAVALRDRIEDRGRVLVVGAGFIGAEVAASCRSVEVDVTMVEVAEVPLERVLGATIGASVATLHRHHGVDLRLGTGVDSVEPRDDGGFDVQTTDGEHVTASAIVVGIGVEPATDWLEGSGLTLDDGVVCDETLLAAPGVVAAGDVLRWPSARYETLMRVEHWEHAISSGQAAARRLAFDLGVSPDEDHDDQPVPFDPVPWFWSDQYDRKMQLAGRSGADHDVEVAHGSIDELRFVAVYGRNGIGTGVFAMNRPRHVTLLRQRLEDGIGFDELVQAAAEL